MNWNTNWRRDRRTELPAGEWKPVVGFPNYWVSADGEVFTEVLGRSLRQTVGKNGYFVVNLSCGGITKTRTVHSLVIEAFVGPKPDALEARHLDGNAHNNRLVNLKYGTSSQNKLDTVAHGHHHNANKTHCRHGHAFDPANTLHAPPGKPTHRQCRACARLRLSKYKRSRRRARSR